VIAIAADSHQQVRAFLKKYAYRLPVVVDQYGSAMHAYRVRALPATYVVNVRGRITHAAVGQVDWADTTTRQLLAGLLRQRLTVLP
jgi:peroxiredoxin